MKLELNVRGLETMIRVDEAAFNEKLDRNTRGLVSNLVRIFLSQFRWYKFHVRYSVVNSYLEMSSW